MRLETLYAEPVGSHVGSPDNLETLWNPPAEATYEEFPENHSRFLAFLSISRVLEIPLVNTRQSGGWREWEKRCLKSGGMNTEVTHISTAHM
jgi:hypothetical protein